MNIYGYTLEKLEKYLVEKNEKSFRAVQIYEWLYRYMVTDFSEMTNIKKSCIEILKNDFSLELLSCVQKQESVDGTIKFLFKLTDGNLIETVLMNHDYGYSACVTTEVGCNMGCAFCASGLKKKLRNLETEEIVLQVLTASKLANVKITHVVVMGIGEPFDNYENVMDFLHIINHAHGLAIGARHMSVSTCGIVPKIYEYANFDIQSNLAISLHAPNNKVRDYLMPINKAYPLEVLMKAIKDYIDVSNRRVTIEYILLRGVNDTKENALELYHLLKGLNVYVNLIPYNEVLEQPFKRSTEEAMRIFYDTLKKNRLNVTLRKEQGGDIDAACGQLRSKEMNKKA